MLLTTLGAGPRRPARPRRPERCCRKVSPPPPRPPRMPAFPASAAVDGNLTGTRWSSAFSDPQWLQVDLGATATISQVVLTWEAAYGKSFQIQTSNDASTWTSIYCTTTGTGGTQTLTVSGIGPVRADVRHRPRHRLRLFAVGVPGLRHRRWRHRRRGLPDPVRHPELRLERAHLRPVACRPPPSRTSSTPTSTRRRTPTPRSSPTAGSPSCSSPAPTASRTTSASTPRSRASA